MTAFKKMLGPTQPIVKREFEECGDAAKLARNVLLKTHRFSPYQHNHAHRCGRAVILVLCPGSESVWLADRHQLRKVSQEQLRMATITERVTDDVIHQELRVIGKHTAAERQILTKYVDISKDPRSPSAEEFTQANPEERATETIRKS